MMKGQIAIDGKVIAGILGVLLLGGAGVYLLTPEQLDAAYTCTTNNVTGIFDKFSGTMKTAYWTYENGLTKQSVCTKGLWIPTTQWLKDNNIDAKEITLSDPKEVPESTIDEDGNEIKPIEVISVDTKTITIAASKQVSINNVVYNLTYVEQPKEVVYQDRQVIKCICEKTAGCKIQECLT